MPSPDAYPIQAPLRRSCAATGAKKTAEVEEDEEDEADEET